MCAVCKKGRRILRFTGLWRSEGDSNPRYAFDVYTLSRRASSATRASLLGCIFQYGCKDTIIDGNNQKNCRLFFKTSVLNKFNGGVILGLIFYSFVKIN